MSQCKPTKRKDETEKKLETAEQRRPALRLRTDLRAGKSRPLTGFY